VARKRLVSPEFFTHEELYYAERDSGLPLRLAYEGLWCQSDRRGLFVWKPGTLKLGILPFDECDFRNVLDALETAGFIASYVVHGQRYGWCITLVKHQTFHRDERPNKLIPLPPIELQNTVQARLGHSANTVLAALQHGAGTVLAPSQHSASTPITVTSTVTSTMTDASAPSSSSADGSIPGTEAFLDRLPTGKRGAWTQMFDAWRNGMDFSGGKAASDDDLNAALRDWLVANPENVEPKPNHVRAFVQQAMRSRKNGVAKDEASEEDAARFGYAGVVYDAIVSEGLARPQPNEEYLAKLKRLEEAGVVHSAAELRADLKLLGVAIGDVANKRTRAEGVRLIADTLRTKRRTPNATPNGAHV
jgi:hypothetical protein